MFCVRLVRVLFEGGIEMADGSGPGRVTLSGVVLAGLLLVLIIASLYLFIAQPFWFPPLASEHGGRIDSLFGTVLVVSGIAFVLVQGALGLFVARYGANGNERAAYWHDNPKVEAILLITTAVILTVLVFMGQRVWASIYFADQPQNATIIQITGEQFFWNFHYPGADGQFGRTDTKLITSTNNIGLDRNDPVAKDDVVSVGIMHVPIGKPVRVRLRSKDVIHSFFLPNFRLKQDAVPGMGIEVWFTPTRAGQYEVACAELCGLGHYRMKAALTVDESEEAFNAWLKMAAEQQ
ncbi:MAG: cytochrome c oxidase subunit II [Acidobacteria bacterium]|nr:MAG: cytochrome c oxidase subunit II [Acidobacteriota bacterium]